MIQHQKFHRFNTVLCSVHAVGYISVDLLDITLSSMNSCICIGHGLNSFVDTLITLKVCLNSTLMELPSLMNMRLNQWVTVVIWNPLHIPSTKRYDLLVKRSRFPDLIFIALHIAPITFLNEYQKRSHDVFFTFHFVSASTYGRS